MLRALGSPELIAPLIAAVQELASRHDEQAMEHAAIQTWLAVLEADAAV